MTEEKEKKLNTVELIETQQDRDGGLIIVTRTVKISGSISEKELLELANNQLCAMREAK